MPVLVFAGATDGIAPVASVKAVVPLLTGSPEVRFEIVPGGHLGMLTGRAARTHHLGGARRVDRAVVRRRRRRRADGGDAPGPTAHHRHRPPRATARPLPAR